MVSHNITSIATTELLLHHHDTHDDRSTAEGHFSEFQPKFHGFLGLCREVLWDRSRSWDIPSPEFGSCLERTLLIWLPSGFLWVLAPLYIIFLRRRFYNPIPWSALTYTKLLLSVLLVLASASELIWAALNYPYTSAPSDILASSILLLSYSLHIYLIYLGRRKGERTSGILWIFWALVVICGIPQAVTSVMSVVYMSREMSVILITTFTLQYYGGIALFICNCICDAPSKLEQLTVSQKPNPEQNASFPSQLMYWWTFGLIWRGWRQPIVIDDLWDMRTDNNASTCSKNWQDDFDYKKSKHKKSNLRKRKESVKIEIFLHWRLWRIMRGTFAYCIFLYFAAELMRFLTPPLLSLLIQLVNDSNEPSWHGYIYAVSLLLVCEFSSVVKNKYFYDMVNVGVRIRTTLMSAVYVKALNLSGSARRESTIGQIVNLMAVDAQMIGDTCWQLGNLIGAPVNILVAVGFLWQRLGPSVLSGLAVLVFLIPINSYLANKIKACRLSCMKIRDKRVKMISEIISGIKVLKLYAWEESFAKQVNTVRNEEIRYLRKIGLLEAFSAFVFHVSPYLVALATFTTYLLASEDNVLNAELAFVSISLFNLMKLPMTQMPNVIAQIIQANVALQRMKKFLSSGELDSNAVCSDSSESGHLAIVNGQFSWEGVDDEAAWTLKDVNLRVKKGTLLAVVGSVGAGKSSLISALLGEMSKDAGRVVVNGSVSYVSQQPWLQNATIRDNITWGQLYDDHWYQKVIKACALLPDLEMLPAGDLTVVGEKGISLSGGQKQRISVARAVYRDADVFLLDDPLSAVDAHVGKSIFEDVIGPSGLLKSKTRLLVTHAVTFLPQVDEVVVVNDGHLVEKGTYSELVAADGEFAQFIVQYLKSCEDTNAEEEILELCDQLEGVAKRNFLQQISQISSSGSCNSVSGQQHYDSNRQRSISESQYGVGNEGNTPRLLQRHGSKSLRADLKNSFNDIQSYGSKSSIRSAGRDRKYEIKSMNGTDARKTDDKNQVDKNIKGILDDEESETGKVARYVYIVYGEAMGMVMSLLPVILMALGQASVAGSNVWLSLWSTSGNSVSNGSLSSAYPDARYSNTTSDNVISREVFLAGYGIFGVAQAFFIFVGMLLSMLGSLKAANTLHEGLLDRVIRFPMSFFDTNPSGRIINRFSKEINTLDNILPMTVRAFISTATQVIATLVVIIASTPIAAVFMLPIMAVYYFIQVIYVATARQLKRIESVSKSPIYSHFSETIQGVSVIRAFKKQDEFFEESISKINYCLRAVCINVCTNRWAAVHLETLGNLITFAAAILAVLSRDTVSPGIVGLSVTYALSVTMVLNWLVRIASDLEANIVSVERINEYLQKEKEAEWRIKGQSPSVTWPERGSVSFDDYKMCYRPGLELVLKGISCNFQPGEKVGIVGRTGAGKSSLTLALFRLVESAGGSIEIDGVKIANIGLHDLRSQISIIPQDPVLFSGTLRFNLDPFETCKDADIWKALELAHLSDYVKSQTLGIHLIVDEEGSNFSVGQRQLVCLARALLRQSQILVLDEATAAVDLETDDLIQDTIREHFKDCTVLTIAHRLNTIMDCDRVLVLDQGKIAELDTPSSLLAKPDSIFYSMARDAGLI